MSETRHKIKQRSLMAEALGRLRITRWACWARLSSW